MTVLRAVHGVTVALAAWVGVFVAYLAHWDFGDGNNSYYLGW